MSLTPSTDNSLTTLSRQQFDRTVALFQQYAGKEQSIRVRFSYGSFNVLCSELAMYRLCEKYRHASQNLISYGHSKPFQSFYFSLEVPGTEGPYFDTAEN